MTRLLSTRNGRIAAALAATAVVALGVVLAVAGTGASHRSASGAHASNSLVITVSNLKGAPANRVVVRAVLADAQSHLVQQGILNIHGKVTINPLPATARILAVSVGDCARLPVAVRVKGHKHHGKHPRRRFRVDCGTFTHASSLAPITLSGRSQTITIGLYCLRPDGVIDCSASRVKIHS